MRTPRNFVGLAWQLDCPRWPFDVVWDEVRDRESGAVDGQFSQLRKAAGSRLNEVGFDPATEGKRRPWQGR